MYSVKRSEVVVVSLVSLGFELTLAVEEVVEYLVAGLFVYQLLLRGQGSAAGLVYKLKLHFNDLLLTKLGFLVEPLVSSDRWSDGFFHDFLTICIDFRFEIMCGSRLWVAVFFFSDLTSCRP